MVECSWDQHPGKLARYLHGILNSLSQVRMVWECTLHTPHVGDPFKSLVVQNIH